MADTATVRQNIQTIRALSNDLAGFLHTLPDGVWRDPDIYASACGEWKVADVVTHLITIAGMKTMSIQRALRGNASPPMGYKRKPAEERLQEIVNLREAFYEDIFYEFNASCLRLNSLLVGLEPDQYHLPAWHPATVMDVSRLIDLRLMELAVHAWDIRYGFDRNAKINPVAVPFLKGWLPNWLRASFRKPADLEDSVTFRFALTDSDGEAHDLVVSSDSFSLEAADLASEADVTVSLDTSAYILFLMGRVNLRRSVRRRQIGLEGDMEVAARFGEWFVGV